MSNREPDIDQLCEHGDRVFGKGAQVTIVRSAGETAVEMRAPNWPASYLAPFRISAPKHADALKAAWVAVQHMADVEASQ